MKKWLALIGCFVLATVNLLAAAELATFTLQPANSRVQAGETFSVDLYLTTDIDLFRATARVISSNPKVIIKDVEFPAVSAGVIKRNIKITDTEYIVGQDSFFGLIFTAGYEGVIATVVFEVAADAVANDDVADLTLSTEDHGFVEIGCYDYEYNEEVATILNGGSMTVVKLFNAPPLTGVATEDDPEQVVLTPGVSPNIPGFTDDAGNPVAGVIREVTPEYPDGGDASTHGATHGLFAISADGQSILYTAPTVVRDMDTFEVVATYEADNGTISQLGANSDTGTITITVTPVNDLPAVTIDDEEVSVDEGEKLVFTVTIEDEEGDEFELTVWRQDIDGEEWIEIKGDWDDGEFTSKDPFDFEEVKHPAENKEVNLMVVAIDKLDEDSTGYGLANLTINDVDRPVGAPTGLEIKPEEAYVTSELSVTFTDAVDPDDEDVVAHTYAWTNDQNVGVIITTETVPAGTAKKGETWTVEVTAYSEYNPAYTTSGSASTFINNSAPEAFDGTLFVQMTDTPPDSNEIDLALPKFAFDADGTEDFDSFIITVDPDPLKGTLTPVPGSISRFVYTVTATDEFYEPADLDSFTFKVKDKSGVESEEATIYVTYRTNPPPVFVEGSATDFDVDGYPEAEVLTLTASVKVGDTDNAGGSVPGAGVASVVWKLKVNGEDKSGWVDNEYEPGSIKDEETGFISCTINFPGYETVAGINRPEELVFELSVVATDGYEGGGSDSAPFVFPDIIVRDNDRAPGPPTSIDLQKAGNGIRTALALVTGDTVTALADGAIDPDGDALLGYEYDWQLTNEKLTKVAPITSDTVAEDTACAWPFGRTLIKGDILAVAARAVSAPLYDLQATLSSSTYGAAAVIVGNTAPEFVTGEGITWALFESANGTDSESKNLAFAWKMGGGTRNGVDDPLLVANDIDAAASDALADSLVFSIDQESYDADETGQIDIGEDDKSIVYVPKRFYNGSFSVNVVVTDEDGDSDTYALNITVQSVNDPPVIAANDVYALPSDCDGETLQVKYFAVYPGGDDESENDQLLDDAFVAVEDIYGILVAGTLAVEPINDLAQIEDEDLAARFAAAGATRAIKVEYVLSADAPMGEELNVTLQVNDDGGTREGMNDNIGIASFKIVLGATPWYPIYQLPCEEHATHQVTLTAPGQPTVVVYVSGNTLMPEHYYYSGSTGLTADIEYDVELRPWNTTQGVAGPPCEVDNDDDLILPVPEYDLPGQAEVDITGPDAETGKYTFAIKAPLAGSYVLTITRNEAAFKTISSNFVPNAEGLILPNVELQMDLFAEGVYEAIVYGINPLGAGEDSEPATVTVGAGEGSVAELAWPADGQFVPDFGKNIVVPAGAAQTTVRFTWPVVSAATAYNFFLYDSLGHALQVDKNIQANTKEVKIALAANAGGSYTWWVEAVSGNAALASPTLSFRLVKQTAAPMVERFTVDADGDPTTLYLNFSAEQGALPAVGSIAYEVQHYQASTQRWIMYLNKDGKGIRPDEADSSTWTLFLSDSTLAVGDYLLIREYVNGKVQGDFVLYRIGAAN